MARNLHGEANGGVAVLVTVSGLSTRINAVAVDFNVADSPPSEAIRNISPDSPNTATSTKKKRYYD